METDNENSYIKYYVVSTKIKDVMANEDNVIGHNINASFSEGDYITK